MEVKWLVEPDAHDENASENVIKALQRQSVPYKLLTAGDYFEERYNHFPKEDLVFFYGSVNVAKAIQARGLWQSERWYDQAKYRCSSFYPILGEKMLSAQHLFATFGDLPRLWSFYQKCFDSDCLFLRPDGADKMFAGQVVEDYQRFLEKEYVYLAEFAKPESLCLVANAFKIENEYRLMIAKGKVVTGSCYRLDGRVHRTSDVPQDVIDYANGIVCNFQPDDLFILDVCKSAGNLYCLEINPIVSAGLYAIDADIFVSTINEVIGESVNLAGV